MSSSTENKLVKFDRSLRLEAIPEGINIRSKSTQQFDNVSKKRDWKVSVDSGLKSRKNTCGGNAVTKSNDKGLSIGTEICAFQYKNLAESKLPPLTISRTRPTLRTKYSSPRVSHRSPTSYSRIQPSSFTSGWQMWRFPSPSKYPERLADQGHCIKQKKDSDLGNSSFGSGQNTSHFEDDLIASLVTSPDQTLETRNFQSFTAVSHAKNMTPGAPYTMVTDYRAEVVQNRVLNKPFTDSGRNTSWSGTESRISADSRKQNPPDSYSNILPNACSSISQDSGIPVPLPASYYLQNDLSSKQILQSRNLPSYERNLNFLQKIQGQNDEFLDILTRSSVTDVIDFLGCVRNVTNKILQTEINYLQLKFRIETLLICFNLKQVEVRGLDLLIVKLCNGEENNIKHQSRILKELGAECIQKLMDKREKANAAIAACIKYRLLVKNIVNFPLDMFSNLRAATDKLRQYRSKICYLERKSPWLIKECNFFKFQYENVLSILRDVEQYCLPNPKR